MQLSLEDERVHIRLTRTANNQLRLVMDFPREDRYRDRILTAFADFLKAPSQNEIKQVVLPSLSESDNDTHRGS